MSTRFLINPLVSGGLGSMSEESSDSSFLLDIIKNILDKITSGEDISKISIPVDFIEPRSLLETYSDMIMHAHLLNNIAIVDNEVERFIAVLKWYLSPWHVIALPKGCRKPYNPILGEQFICFYDNIDGSKTDYIAEQVSHHPPISAINIENRVHNYTLNAYVKSKGHFYGNSVASDMEGCGHLYFTNHSNERYSMTWPTIYAMNVLVGTMHFEIGGNTCFLRCEKTGYEAQINFLTKPMIGGEYNAVEGTIRKIEHDKTLYTFEGKWDEVVKLKKLSDGTEEIICNSKEQPKLNKITSNDSYLGPNDSRKVWADLTNSILSKDYKAATKFKETIEDNQRLKEKERIAAKIEYKPLYFENIDNQWVFKDLCLDEYDEYEDRQRPEELLELQKAYYEAKSNK